jgi:FKBP-type peptidyl-prolyl cis-trans isomerase FkpA
MRRSRALWLIFSLSTVVPLALLGCSKKQDPAGEAATAQEAPADAGHPAATEAAQGADSGTAGGTAASASTTDSAPSSASAAPMTLQITDIKTGTGPAIKAGQTAVVHYTGWLYSESAPEKKGQKFDSSRDRNDPFPFPVGAGQVIQGWDDGVAGMQVGGQRRLVIPPAMGYGASGAGGVIPPNATLVFDVELLGIK